MSKSRTHETSSRTTILGAAVLAVLFAASAPGCDTEGRSDDQDRSLTLCQLGEGSECTALPELAEAIDVVEAIGIDPQRESVELWVGQSEEFEELWAAHEASLACEADASADACDSGHLPQAGDSLVEPLPVSEMMIKQELCEGTPGSCTCCCGWSGSTPTGCYCTGCW
jgi:hypothetical protein